MRMTMLQKYNIFSNEFKISPHCTELVYFQACTTLIISWRIVSGIIDPEPEISPLLEKSIEYVHLQIIKYAKFNKPFSFNFKNKQIKIL